jgi:hypothetical protein
MKRLTMNSLVVAAALTAVAGSAAAQTMKAEIPFTFRAGGAVLTPGTYVVKIDSGGSGQTHFVLRNEETRQSVIVGQTVQGLAPRQWRADGQARLGFECVGARCALRNIWSGGDTRAYYLPGPKLGGNETARAAEVALTKAN